MSFAEPIADVAAAAVALRTLRREARAAPGWSLRELHGAPDEPGDNPLRTTRASTPPSAPPTPCPRPPTRLPSSPPRQRMSHDPNMEPEVPKFKNKEVFTAALERMQSTWKTFVVTLCTLHLLLFIDALNGSHFMNEGGAIEVGGFKIVREALSATYGLLFTLFVFRAWLESRVAWKICKAEPVVPISAVETKAVLWLVSPFSWFRALRWVFWGLLADGFITLAVFSAIHIGNVRSLPNWLKLVESGIAPPGNPRPITLPPWAYKGIGYMDLVLLLVCLWPCVGLIQNLRRIRKRFTRSEGPV